MALTTSRGVLAGTNQPCQLEDSKPTSPVSATVGTSGSAGERSQRSGCDMRQCRRHGRNGYLDLPGDESGENPRVPFVWNRLDVDAGRGLEHFHGQVERIADTGHAVVETARLGLRE